MEEKDFESLHIYPALNKIDRLRKAKLFTALSDIPAESFYKYNFIICSFFDMFDLGSEDFCRVHPEVLKRVITKYDLRLLPDENILALTKYQVMALSPQIVSELDIELILSLIEKFEKTGEIDEVIEIPEDMYFVSGVQNQDSDILTFKTLREFFDETIRIYSFFFVPIDSVRVLKDTRIYKETNLISLKNILARFDVQHYSITKGFLDKPMIKFDIECYEYDYFCKMIADNYIYYPLAKIEEFYRTKLIDGPKYLTLSQIHKDKIKWGTNELECWRHALSVDVSDILKDVKKFVPMNQIYKELADRGKLRNRDYRAKVFKTINSYELSHIKLGQKLFRYDIEQTILEIDFLVDLMKLEEVLTSINKKDRNEEQEKELTKIKMFKKFRNKLGR